MKKLILPLIIIGCAAACQAQTPRQSAPSANRLAAQAPTQVTIGRERLGKFAPKFAEINDDIVYGQIWSREKELPLRERSMITIAAMIAGNNFEQLKFQMERAKEYGVTKQEMSELITHLSFYVGGPRAWSAFEKAIEVYGE
ncbi:carboxymuconolactone decarboxylase family protein [Neisseria sp.]|uniref:carboxymuconolactone decarboxylase family protein n=1 Tax=Neisseria sp. TaxID=192066 RepID=UPI0026DCDD0F|nr:carboxymuconolactone decarboxylase family protein [Neisseria sp.]MDO4907918.1 carboxymuconolactone decarboxylase family protein [Neisseria sp.]